MSESGAEREVRWHPIPEQGSIDKLRNSGRAAQSGGGGYWWTVRGTRDGLSDYFFTGRKDQE